MIYKPTESMSTLKCHWSKDAIVQLMFSAVYDQTVHIHLVCLCNVTLDLRLFYGPSPASLPLFSSFEYTVDSKQMFNRNKYIFADDWI